MIPAGELAAMRATSVSALPDTCTVERATGAQILDEDTGVLSTPAAEVYSGPCRIRPVTSADESIVFGDTEQTRQRYVATFPHDVGAAVDDIVTVTTGSDPAITSRSFRVAVVSAGSWLIDRRVGLELIE